MSKRILFGLAVVAALTLLPAAGALAQDSSSAEAASGTSSEAMTPVPDEMQDMIGDWTLEQEDDTLPKCPLKLTDQQAIGGWAIEVPTPCPAPYPSADKLYAWNQDPNTGAVLLLDAERHVVLTLNEDEDGLYDTDLDKPPRFYLVAPEDANGAAGEADDDGASNEDTD